MKPLIILLPLIAGLLGGGPAWALNFFELEVYPATTEGAGLHELESQSSFVVDGRTPSDEERAGEEPHRHHLLRTSIEYNYGLTDKVDLALYTDLMRPNGEAFEYAGSRARARGALWDKGRYFLDLGWYFEAEFPHNTESDLELELRPIVSRDFGRFSVDLNPIFELPTVTEEQRTFEFNYAARVYYRLSPKLRPGVEFFGDIGQIRKIDPAREQEHYVLPILYTALSHGLKVAIGTGFGITRASDPVIIKLNVEYEFTWPGGLASTPAPVS